MSIISLDKGYFITFEGGEGGGKSTLIEKIYIKCHDHGLQVIKTREPGGTRLGEEIRHILLTPDLEGCIDRKAELFLFLAARIQHIEEVIKPALRDKKIVLCDRFNDSSIAYQGAGRELGIQEVKVFCELACDSFKPDLAFFLDLDPSLGLTRAKQTDKQEASCHEMDRMERAAFEFHQKIRAGFRILAEENPDTHTIDATQSPEEVFQVAWKTVMTQLKKGS